MPTASPTTTADTEFPSPAGYPGQARVDATDAEGRRRADRALRGAAIAWFVVAVTGQLIFAAYILLLYGRSALKGDWAAWGRVMPHGLIPGDTVGNAAIASHLLMAVIIILAGVVQLIPAVRRRAPGLHRWSGRAYLVGAIVASIGGFYLIWVRGTVGGVVQHLGTSSNAVAIIAFAVLAWRAARERRYGDHARWALRVWLAGNGVWFFRIGLLLWLLIFRRPVGFDAKTFLGPFLDVLTYAQWLLPLAVFEGYGWVRRQGTTAARYAMTGTLAALTVATAVGIFGATMGLWLRRL